MRCVDRKTFLSLPAGTIYCKGKQWFFEGLCIKGDSIGDIDWYEHDPAWVDADDSGEAFDRLEKMLTAGASFPMQDSECRDALFDKEAIFLIFERDDLQKLRGYVDTALNLPETIEGSAIRDVKAVADHTT
jgi:hypothetical protein